MTASTPPTLDDVVRTLATLRKAATTTQWALPHTWYALPRELALYRRFMAIDAMESEKGLAWVAGARPLVPALVLDGVGLTVPSQNTP